PSDCLLLRLYSLKNLFTMLFHNVNIKNKICEESTPHIFQSLLVSKKSGLTSVNSSSVTSKSQSSSSAYLNPSGSTFTCIFVSPMTCTRNSRRSEEHTSELQSRFDLVCRLLLEKQKKQNHLIDYLVAC